MKYEYKQVSLVNGIEEINKQGQDGWRVVTLFASVAIMERETKEEVVTRTQKRKLT